MVLLPFNQSSRAIAHIDGDAFFASVEQAMDPRLRGRPVVTGKERGIASSMSYEAKARGVTRGMPLHDIRRLCPDCVIVPSDYETYSLFSVRMFDIVRRYTADVEEYSIDECFADLTGLRRPLRIGYREMAERIKADLDTELGMTFSVGLAPTKVLAKMASKWKKPSGLTVISGRHIEEYLAALPVDKVWGIGPQTSAFLAKHRIATALDFARQDDAWVKRHLSKPYQEIWHELRGTPIYPVTVGKKTEYKSIGKTKTFTPPSTDRAYVLAQLSKNIENACIKARRYDLRSDLVFVFLKTQDYRYRGLELRLRRPVNVPGTVMRAVEARFDELYVPALPYRATGAVLMNLESQGLQPDLFGEHAEIERMEKIYASVAALSRKYGKHTVFLGSSFKAMKNSQHLTERGDQARRKTQLLKGETERQRIGIPYLGDVE
jgi:nucleotidyltransferase/DNA polymerase involved in DNA repair